MLRLLLISLLCAILIACSSDDSDTLKEWFDDQKIAVSYKKDSQDFEIPLKSFACGSPTYYMAGSYSVLGDTNGVEYTLYFGLENLKILSDGVWKLKTDSLFEANYKDTYDATIYWLRDDSIWTELKVEKVFTGSSEKTKIKLQADTFLVHLPEELQKLSDSTFKLLVGIKLEEKAILHIESPTGVLVAQKTEILEDCEQSRLLHAGARESLSVFFDMKGINFDKTVVFAELILPKSEFEQPVPIYAYNEKGLENYRVDSAYVREYGHPNLLFGGGDELKIQVTGSLRNYAAIGNSRPDDLGFTLRLSNPMSQPNFPYYIHNSLYYYSVSEKIFEDRPAYLSYDFGTTLENAKLRIWFADYGEDKK